MRFTDPMPFIPKIKPPSRSWWADAEAQSSRAKFNEWARAEQERIVGNERFGGAKNVHDRGLTKNPK